MPEKPKTIEGLARTLDDIDNNILQPDFYTGDDRIMIDRKKFLHELDALETERLKELNAQLESHRQKISLEMATVAGLKALQAA